MPRRKLLILFSPHEQVKKKGIFSVHRRDIVTRFLVPICKAKLAHLGPRMTRQCIFERGTCFAEIFCIDIFYSVVSSRHEVRLRGVNDTAELDSAVSCSDPQSLTPRCRLHRGVSEFFSHASQYLLETMTT